MPIFARKPRRRDGEHPTDLAVEADGAFAVGEAEQRPRAPRQQRFAYELRIVLEAGERKDALRRLHAAVTAQPGEDEGVEAARSEVRHRSAVVQHRDRFGSTQRVEAAAIAEPEVLRIGRAQLRSEQRGEHRPVRLMYDGGGSRVDHERRHVGAAPRQRSAAAEESRGLERHERRVGEVAVQREQR